MRTLTITRGFVLGAAIALVACGESATPAAEEPTAPEASSSTAPETNPPDPTIEPPGETVDGDGGIDDTATTEPDPLADPSADSTVEPDPPADVRVLPDGSFDDLVIQPGDLDSGGATITGEAPPQVVAELIERVADEASVDPSEVTVVASFAKTWTDGSLGCGEPGMVYTQREEAGYQVELAAAGESWDFRVRDGGQAILCDNAFVLPSRRGG